VSLTLKTMKKTREQIAKEIMAQIKKEIVGDFDLSLLQGEIEDSVADALSEMDVEDAVDSAADYVFNLLK